MAAALAMSLQEQPVEQTEIDAIVMEAMAAPEEHDMDDQPETKEAWVEQVDSENSELLEVPKLEVEVPACSGAKELYKSAAKKEIFSTMLKFVEPMIAVKCQQLSKLLYKIVPEVLENQKLKYKPQAAEPLPKKEEEVIEYEPDKEAPQMYKLTAERVWLSDSATGSS